MLGLSKSDLKPPLSNFNAATISKDALLKLVRSLNDGLKEKALGETQIGKIFEKWWPDLEGKLKQSEEALAGGEKLLKPPPTRSLEDMLGELLELTRSLAQRQDAASWPADISSLGFGLGKSPTKGVGMLTELFDPPGSLADVLQRMEDKRIGEAVRRRYSARGLLNATPDDLLDAEIENPGANDSDPTEKK